MDWLSASLPIWIIGAPLAYAIFDWMRTPKPSSSTSSYTMDGRRAPLAA